MKKRSLFGALATAALLPALTIAPAGEAFADGNVQWKSHANDGCLSYTSNDDVLTAPCDSSNTTWYDNQLSDGNWNEFAAGKCLDSNAKGSVYLNPCYGNEYQRWSEEKWSNGWVLKNVATGRCLMVWGAGYVGTLPCSSDNYQFWS